jgi:SagB-type dehydrogenase family enzyme
MKVEWSARVDEHLKPQREDRLSLAYHENSKLTAETARSRAAEFAMSPLELYLSTRAFRQFDRAPRVLLPDPEIDVAVSLPAVLQRRRSRRALSAPVSLGEISTLLQIALGPTLVYETEPEGHLQALRAWPSAGALYPIDTYVLAQHVTGLEPGVYHYNLAAAALERMPVRRAVAAVMRDGFFWQDWVVGGAAAVLLVACFDRTLAKYGERGYRLVLLDAGHAGQNILLVAESLDLPACPIAGFCDDSLADSLALDGATEAVAHAVIIGGPIDTPEQRGDPPESHEATD